MFEGNGKLLFYKNTLPTFYETCTCRPPALTPTPSSVHSLLCFPFGALFTEGAWYLLMHKNKTTWRFFGHPQYCYKQVQSWRWRRLYFVHSLSV
ncbi:hypothetical protein XELAEV_18019957mg [Xenopus laevis]|uniref:Uncharacterized protein n=1 Tax=Xenopus laevis TaxID=8355 RepID=A0A974D8T9_XENLA|nr:hypothetical protein XELAEV_18019957mg [Xenopus laevis]